MRLVTIDIDYEAIPRLTKCVIITSITKITIHNTFNFFSHHHNPQDVHLWGAGGHKSPNIHARNTIQTSGYDHCWGPDEVGLRMVKIMMRALILMVMIT